MNDIEQTLVGLLQRTLGAVVNHKERLNIQSTTGSGVLLLLIKCAPEDYGKVVGASGSTIDSLAVIMAVIGRRYNLDCRVMLAESPVRARDNSQKPVPNATGLLDDLFSEIVAACFHGEHNVRTEPLGRGRLFVVELREPFDLENLPVLTMKRLPHVPVEDKLGAALQCVMEAAGRTVGVSPVIVKVVQTQEAI